MTIDKAELEDLLAQGYTQRSIAKILGHGTGTVNTWVHRHGLADLALAARKQKTEKDTCVIELCSEQEIAKGLCKKHYKRLWRHGDPNVRHNKAHEITFCPRCNKPAPFRAKYCGKTCRKAHAKEQLITRLTVSSTLSSGGVKDGCFRHNLLEPKCVGCGLTEWTSSFGTTSPLQLDHVNGDSTDNRLENLRILCANCHTQTDTFCGKNIGSGTRKRSTRLSGVNSVQSQ